MRLRFHVKLAGVVGILAVSAVIGFSQARTADQYQSVPFSQLTTTAPNGSVRYCPNCAQSNPCSVGTAGAVAQKINGTWRCSAGGSSGVTTFNGRSGVVLPLANDYPFSYIGSVTQNKLLGRGVSSGTGVIQEITLGSGLTLTGTTLSTSGGSGTVTGSGSLGRIAKWSSTSAITNSIMSESSNQISITGGLITTEGVNAGTFVAWPAGSNLTSTTNGHIKFKNLAGTTFSKMFFGAGSTEQRIEFGTGTGVGTGDFNFYAGGANAGALLEAGSFQTQAGDGNGLNLRAALGSVYVQAASGVGSYTPWVFSFPSTDGAASQFMQTDGGGATTWATAVTPSGTMTSNAVLKGAGAAVAQASGVTIDSGDNLSTAGGAQFGVGSAVAGNLALESGTATIVATNTVQLQAPTSVTGYNLVQPIAAGNGLIYNSNASNVVTQTFVNAETILATATSVNMNTATATTLYTCPTGKSCVITRLIIRNASTSLTTVSFSIGWNSAAFDNVVANATHTELTGATLYTILPAKAGATLGTSTGVLKLLDNTLQGGAATCTVEVVGWWF